MPPATQRTQAERRNATLRALKAATIDSLIANGVAGTSTRSVSEMAGVSQGAMQHYFPNKVQLVEAALSSHLVTVLDELLAPPYAPGPSRDRAEQLVDRIWAFHRLPAFGAVFELLALAKRDRATAQRTAATLEVLLTQIEDAATLALPGEAGRSGGPGWSERIRMVVSAVRGEAAIDGISAAADHSSSWPGTRAGLVALLLGR